MCNLILRRRQQTCGTMLKMKQGVLLLWRFLCTQLTAPYDMASSYFLTAIRTMCLILLYYCFSIGITFYQKWLIQDFHFPLVVVFVHLVVKFILATLLRVVWQFSTGRRRIMLPWSVYARTLAATGIASALDIGFSNWSFEFITVSLYTMTKSTCIIFILGFSLLFGLEEKRTSLVAVIGLIATGLFLFTYQSTQFNLEGFLLVLSASFLGGLRWTLAQLVMQRKALGLSNPVDMIYHIQPWMMVGLMPLAIMFEGVSLATTERVFRYSLWENCVETLIRVGGGAILAFLMELSEYLLITYTSSLTLSLAGIVKEIFTLYLAVVYSGDVMSPMNTLGLIVCLFGIALHVLMKALHSQTTKKGGGTANDSKIIGMKNGDVLLQDSQELTASQELLLPQEHPSLNGSGASRRTRHRSSGGSCSLLSKDGTSAVDVMG